MSKWETIKLGDILKIKHGFAFKGEFFSDLPTNNILVTPGNFNIGGGFKDSKFKYYSGEFPEEYILAANNVIVTMTDLSKAGDTLGYSAKVPAMAGKNLLHNQRIGLLQFNNDQVSQDFIYWLLRTKKYQSFILGSATGSTVKHTSPSRISEFEFELPPLQEQQRIADILSAFDDKITLNREMNKTLEAMAQAIFKSWFIDFEPFRDGEFVESELGMIPQGWEVKPLSEDFVITMGQSPDGKTYNENGEGIPFFQGRTDFGFRFPSNRIYCTDPKRYAKKFDTLVSVRAPVGDMNLAIEDCCIGRGLSAVRHKKGYYSFTYYLLKSIDEKFKQFEHNGTVFGSINKASFENLKAIIPNDVLICDFEKIVNAIDDQIYSLSNEIQTLSILRDTLLPKLLSGEIDISTKDSYVTMD